MNESAWRVERQQQRRLGRGRDEISGRRGDAAG